MANDRVFIKCEGCGGWKMLLKYFPSEGLTTRDNDILPWLDSHRYCHPVYGKPQVTRYNLQLINLGSDTGFSLHTESGLHDGSLDMAKQNMRPDGTKT